LSGAPHLQRTIGDGHDLTAARFAGDVVLEAVYDNERLLKFGDKGAAVRKLQQALVDSGSSLPRFGVDGDFRSETKAAVEAFQRASGLTGANIDGIVGPTTMGWLDQRFSAGPTPAGTSPGATTGCPVIKTVNVDLVTLDGSSRNPVQELDKASAIFNQCCVHFNFVGGGSEGAARTQALLGGDDVLNKTTACGSPTAEETSLFSGASADFGLSSRIRAFYVHSTTPSEPAYSFPPFCATGTASALNGMSVVSNSASVRGLAHEFGHHLLNNGVHPGDPLNLMSAPGSPPGEQLTPTDCATIFANA
jgi:peptidoglycan hydrolase-like protein with peptidoglycan-binding domain